MSSDALSSSADLVRLVGAVGALTSAGDDAERIDRIRALEELKAAVTAAQLVEIADFDASQRDAQRAAGVPAARRGRGVAAQVALAMRASHHVGQRVLGLARVLPTELPETFAELQAGRVTEWKAILMTRETAVLSRADRRLVDHDLAPRLSGWGAGQVSAQARNAAYRLDPHAAVARAARAVEQRRVTLRPIPDMMGRLSAEVPVAQSVACWAALKRHADTLVGTGDPRSRGQIMADTFVERLTGQACADAVPVEIHLVMSDQTLLAPPGTPGRDEPALVVGYGPIPAPLAREIASDTCRAASAGNRRSVGHAPRWLRRLLLRPGNRQLAAMDARRRTFTRNQRLFLTDRDQTCRTPYCGAPIRHADHVDPWADGGATDVSNGQGYCAACNFAKQVAGWLTTANPDGSITTRTPTGHEYHSPLPDLPGSEAATYDDGFDPEREPPEDGPARNGVVIGRLVDVTQLSAEIGSAA